MWLQYFSPLPTSKFFIQTVRDCQFRSCLRFLPISLFIYVSSFNCLRSGPHGPFLYLQTVSVPPSTDNKALLFAMLSGFFGLIILHYFCFIFRELFSVAYILLGFHSPPPLLLNMQLRYIFLDVRGRFALYLPGLGCSVVSILRFLYCCEVYGFTVAYLLSV